MSKPVRLNKCSEDILDKELKISVKQLLFILFLVILFFAFCFMMQPQTYGFLSW